MTPIEEAYRVACEQDSDIVDHLPTLAALTAELEATRVIELGVRTGRSSVAFLHVLEQQGGHLWSVDAGSPPPFDHPRWTFIHGMSTAESTLAQLPDRVDLVFIDTDHTLELTLAEIELYRKRAGVLVFHDTAEEAFPHHHAPGYLPQPPFPVRKAIETALPDAKVDYDERCHGLAVAWL